MRNDNSVDHPYVERMRRHTGLMREACDLLVDAGYEVWLHGGVVLRDLGLRDAFTDVDIACNAPVQKAISAFASSVFTVNTRMNGIHVCRGTDFACEIGCLPGASDIGPERLSLFGWDAWKNYVSDSIIVPRPFSENVLETGPWLEQRENLLPSLIVGYVLKNVARTPAIVVSNNTRVLLREIVREYNGPLFDAVSIVMMAGLFPCGLRMFDMMVEIGANNDNACHGWSTVEPYIDRVIDASIRARRISWPQLTWMIGGRDNAIKGLFADRDDRTSMTIMASPPEEPEYGKRSILDGYGDIALMRVDMTRITAGRTPASDR